MSILAKFGMCVPSTCSQADLSTLLLLYTASDILLQRDYVWVMSVSNCVDKEDTWQPDALDVSYM